jgi:hydroxymethylbilane synthase
MQSLPIRIGTRGSQLALAQAHEVRDRLMAAHGFADTDLEVVAMTTTGDRITDRPLAEVGGKGLFTKEIEQALYDGAIDIAVHSMKDMPTELPQGLVIDTFLPRADPRDGFVSPKATTLAALAQGAVVGSSSLRRQAQIRRARPDLKVVTYRGNVNTRLRKLAEGEVDATILACAGLRRIDLDHEITAAMEIDEMLPAVAQGVIGIERRAGDEALADTLTSLNDARAETEVSAERAFLKVLDGSCRTPIAGHAWHTSDGGLVLRGMVLAPDGSEAHETERSGRASDAVAMGLDAGAELKAKLRPEWLA